jgi:hypothetical protein
MKKLVNFRFRSVSFLILIITSYSLAALHKFIAIDEGLGNLLFVNEFDSTANWMVKVNRKVGKDSIYEARDMQLIGNNRILIGHRLGYTEFDCKTGKVMKDFTSYSNVTSIRRLADGSTLIFGIDLDGSKGVVMVKLNPNDTKIKKVIWPGNYVRLVRQTATGTFLMACNDTIKEADTNGTFIWKTYLPGPPTTDKHMWKIVRLENGNMFVAAGYGAFLAEVNKSGNVIRRIGVAPQPSGVNPNFYGMFQILPNENVVVANWQGHGAGHGNAGIQLLEFDKNGTIVWQWNKPSQISSLQGVLVIDSLNTDILYDERSGIMSPLTSVTSLQFDVLQTNKSETLKLIRWQKCMYIHEQPLAVYESVNLLGKSMLTDSHLNTPGTGFFINRNLPHNKE